MDVVIRIIDYSGVRPAVAASLAAPRCRAGALECGAELPGQGTFMALGVGALLGHARP